MDNQDTHDTRIEAYYSGTMQPEDRQSFEQALKTDRNLQNAVKPFQLFDAAVAVQGEAELRTMMRQIVAESPAIPTPKLSLIERISLFLTSVGTAPKQSYSRGYWALGGLSTAVIACLIYANVFVLPLDNMATSKEYSFAPESVGTLGADAQTAFADAQRYYDAGQKEALLLMAADDTEGGTKFVAAQYYLAHFELKNKNAAAAIAAFDVVLQPRNKVILEAESMNIGRVKINRTLTIMALNPDRTNALNLLELLAADPDCMSELTRIKAIQKEINNPWRRLNWRD